MKPIVVGEMEGRDAYTDLFYSRVLGLNLLQFEKLFESHNLVNGHVWSAQEAANKAMDICYTASKAPLVLLGERVAAAFGISYYPFEIIAGEPWIACLPDSLDCSTWAGLASYKKARDLIADVYPSYSSIASGAANRRREIRLP